MMRQFKTGTWPLMMICFAVIAFSSCKKDDEKHPPANFSNYIKKDNKYYKLDAAVAMYDSIAPDKTLFSLSFHSNGADQNMVVFDYLLLQNTYELLPGAYSYQKVQSSQNFGVGKFHDVVLKCNSPVMSGVAYPVSGGTFTVSKSNNAYTVDGELVMSGKEYKVHFAGPIEHLKAW